TSIRCLIITHSLEENIVPDECFPVAWIDRDPLQLWRLRGRRRRWRRRHVLSGDRDRGRALDNAVRIFGRKRHRPQQRSVGLAKFWLQRLRLPLANDLVRDREKVG